MFNVTWTKIDESFSDHPKILDAGPLAELLQIRALQYCNRLLTDGFIPKTAVDRLARDLESRLREDGRRVTAQSLAQKLIAEGIWEQRGDGYVIHDFNQFQPTRAKVLADRAAAQRRMQRLRGSGDVRPNKEGTSGEVREVFGDPVPSPSPLALKSFPIAPRPDERKCWSWLKEHGASEDAIPGILADTRQRAEAKTKGLRSLDAYAMARPEPDRVHLLEECFGRWREDRYERRKQQDEDVPSVIPLPRLRRIE